jgi:hypothetical protein
MGNKFIFREPLQILKSNGNQYYSPKQNDPNKNNGKLADMDIIPKFMANQNKGSNEVMIDRLNKSKNIFNKMMASYFSEKEEFFTSSIQEVETEMNRYKDNLENIKNNDYKGFQELLSFINNNRSNPSLVSMQNMSLSDYKTMNYETKKIILGGIYENRPEISKKLNLHAVNIYQDINPMPMPGQYSGIKKQVSPPQRPRGGTSFSQPPRININTLITIDQIELFRTFIGNPNIPENHVKSYFDPSNPKVVLAADKYFKNIYKLDYLTLYYYYPTKNDGPKIHRFKFVSDISELFMAAQNDYISVMNPRLILENGKEIMNNKRYKCVGALNLSNNTKIKVLNK